MKQTLRDMDLEELLNDLIILKRNGDLDTDEKLAQQVTKWRNTVEYCTIEACVKHYSEQCRLNILALLVESKKTTLHFTHKELDIILLFLKYNLCEAMEYIYLVKVALKRLKGSLAVMQRQLAREIKMRDCRNGYETISETHENAVVSYYEMSSQIEEDIKAYTMFFINLRELCISNLYPDATYHRRRSSLQILLLTQQLLSNEFKNITWKKEQAEIIFQCLLLDTHEPNKEIAYQILKSLSPTLLCLNLKSQVQSLIKVALELGNSIRPIDSITAAYILKIVKLSPVIKDVLCEYCNLEEDIMEAVTLQLVLLLYTKLQASSAVAKQNIGMAIVKCSLYGYLHCIRSLLYECTLSNVGKDKLWQNATANIISLCFELNQTVSQIVNNSSPEGHLPMDLKALNINNDDVSFPEKEIVTPQMVLLCSWRTVKEVSQLFGLFATNASIQTKHISGLLSEEQIEHIMKHLVFLLCETKHRGAFEQAYIGFYELCRRLWRLRDTHLRTLPVHWLHDTLVGITGLMPGYSKLCATRRSAGVPFMMQAVLSSDPCHNLKMSAPHSVMKILLKFTELENTINVWQTLKCLLYEDTVFSKYEHLTESIIENRNEYHQEQTTLNITEIKTHSLNILRALFRHYQLRDIVEDYIADGLIAAFKNYDSKTWAERNAATLLFSALIIRIFGVQRTKDHINLTTYNKMTGRIFFERYPTLLPFLLQELQIFISINDAIMKSNIQAILLLLSRLYGSNHCDIGTDIAWKVDKFVSLVSQCAKSPVHKTRELAARALVSLLTENTACNVVKKLVLFLCTVADTRISANLIHGYLLQILEIFVKFPSVSIQLLKSDILDFLSIADRILNGLEKEIDNFSCFPIASVYIDILHELYNIDTNIIESCDMVRILYTLQRHLIEKNVLREGPGEQMYKISVIQFMLYVEKCSNVLRTAQNGQNKIFEIYSQLLIIPEAKIQSIAWTNVSKVLSEESCSVQRKLLSDYAIRIASDFIKDLYKCNPELQDAFFDFLYNSLMKINERWNDDASNDKREICSLILKMYSHESNNIYHERKHYLRLLGKCMTTLLRELKDQEFKMEYEEIYRKICNNDWIGSSYNKDFILSVFNILYDLYDKDAIDHAHCHPMLDWWTMLLQLLVDDNANIRYNASILICKIEPSNELKCIDGILPIFFQKFDKTIADRYPGIAISALFSWSVSLLGNTHYEMDETDVFNKCRNYDVFEPVKISKLCFDLTKLIKQRYSIDSALPSDAVRWTNYRLGTNFSVLSSFRDIVRNYKDNVPTLEKGLNDILDPMYKDKLLQILAYEKYMSL